MSGTSNGPKNAAVEEWHFLLDTRDAESRYGIEPVDHLTPEGALRAAVGVRPSWSRHCCASGWNTRKAAQKEQLFDGHPQVSSRTEELDAPSHAQLAERLKMTTGAVKTDRPIDCGRRYREILGDEI